MGRTEAAAEEYGVNPRYDDPNAYGIGGSYYGRGRYPPDWESRREAVWKRQRYQCGRCRIYKGDADGSEVHHIVHLASNGSNHLDNLVGLCTNCHALMHPDVDEMRGTPDAAPLFPDEYAEDYVAVLRWPTENDEIRWLNRNDELRTDFEHLSTDSEPTENRYAITSLTVPTDPQTARDAESDLHRLLVENGYVPRTSPYHRVRIAPRYRGLRGAFAPTKPRVRVATDGELHEGGEWEGGVRQHRDDLFTADATKTTIEFEDGRGMRLSENVALDHDEGARIRLEKQLTPPPLTLRSAPRYAANAITHFTWKSFMWGIVPALLAVLAAPGVVPLDGSITGIGILALLVGFVLRSVTFHRELTDDGEDRIVDERADT